MPENSLRVGYVLGMQKIRHKLHNTRPGWIVNVLQHLLGSLSYFTIITCKILIVPRTSIGQGLWLSSRGNIIVGAITIGNDCVIHHNVTLGMGLGALNRRISPTVGNNVWVGPDTLIYGNIIIGDGATILGGSVVSKNIPPDCVVSGNPGCVIRKNFNNKKLRESILCDVAKESLNDWG